jgi:hypothetical protein
MGVEEKPGKSVETQKRPGEEGFVGDIEEARQRAEQVRQLVGERINREFRNLMLARQLPGLENEAKQAADNIRKLYEEAEDVLEGEKYAEIFRYAYEEYQKVGDKRFKGTPVNLVRTLEHKNLNVEEFLRYLEIRFGPRMINKKFRYKTSVFYLLIKNSNFAFKVTLINPGLLEGRSSPYKRYEIDSIMLVDMESEKENNAEGMELEPL